MSSGPRVQWVTRRFWPIVSDSVWHMLEVSSAMQQRGWSMEIITAGWHSSWPADVRLREIDIHRIQPSPTTPFRTRRYARHLLEWIDAGCQAAQVPGQQRWIIAEAGEEDALLLVDHYRDRLPVIVRYDSIDMLGPLSTRLRQRAVTACSRASQVIVPHDHARRELIGAGVSPAQIRVVGDGPHQIIDRSPAARSAARRALADINYELFVRAEDRVVVVLAELTKSAGVEFVVQALGPLIEARRGVRLWIVGDGPERLRLYDVIKRQGWRHDMMMPGTFEDPDLVLSVADLCVIPSPQQGCSWLMQTALASGLPTLLCTGPTVIARLGTSAQALSFETGNAARLQKLFTTWLDDPTCMSGSLTTAANIVKAQGFDLAAIL